MKRRPPLLSVFARAMRGSYTPGEDDPWWYDNLLHFTSGVIIGALSVLLLDTTFLGTAVVFLLLAAVWEAFEYHYSIRPWDEREDWTHDRAVEDTLLDTYMGLTGALMAVLLL